MPDLYLADRLQQLARHEANIAHYGLGQRGEMTPCASVVLAQAMHHTLLSLIVLKLPLQGDLDSERKSLVELARTIVAEEIRDFAVWELEKVALLDVIHMRPVTCVLLPDELPRDIFHAAQGFVENLTREAWTAVEAAKKDGV